MTESDRKLLAELGALQADYNRIKLDLQELSAEILAIREKVKERSQ